MINNVNDCLMERLWKSNKSIHCYSYYDKLLNENYEIEVGRDLPGVIDEHVLLRKNDTN